MSAPPGLFAPLTDDGARTVVSFVDDDDALSFALVSRAARDLVHADARFAARADEGGLRMRTTVDAIVSHGSVALIAWAVDVARCPLDSSIPDQAARHGCVPVLEWAAKRGCVFDSRAAALAAAGGHDGALGWLLARGCPVDSRAAAAAAERGHMPSLHLLCQADLSGCWDSKACRAAARAGRVDVLGWLAERGLLVPDRWALEAAAGGGHLRALEFVRDALEATDGHAPRIGEGVGAAAAAGGHEDLVWWAARRGAHFGDLAMEAAAGGGHRHVLILLRSPSFGCSWSPGVAAAAAARGRVDMLRWLRSQGCPFDVCAVSAAARGGSMAALRWLARHGAPANLLALRGASQAGRSEALSFLREHGCPRTLDAAPLRTPHGEPRGRSVRAAGDGAERGATSGAESSTSSDEDNGRDADAGGGDSAQRPPRRMPSWTRAARAGTDAVVIAATDLTGGDGGLLRASTRRVAP